MSWSNQAKSSSSFSNQSKNSSSFDDGVDFLLKEDTYFLLLEDGYKIVLDQSPNAKHNPTFTNLTKH